MGLFDFVSDWRRRLIDEPLDRRMRETADIGRDVALANVHRITGYLASSISSEYRQSDKTILLHADAPYSLIEETRGPTARYSEHHYLAPAAQAMAAHWGGARFELHFPNASIGRGEMGLGRLRQQESRLYHRLGGGRGGLARRVQIHSRRWHRWSADVPTDPATPVL